MSTTVVWFRQDLRLADHAGLRAALERGGPVVPLYVWAPEEEGRWPPGAASRWWLHHSLAALDAALRELGSRLVLRRGDPVAVLQSVVAESGAGTVCWQRRYEPAAVAQQARVAEALRAAGVSTVQHDDAVLFPPEGLRTKQGGPYRVFTPFWRACGEQPEPGPPLPAPGRLPTAPAGVASEPMEALELLPRVDWAGGLRAAWRPGEAGAAARLRGFLAGEAGGYESSRDLPGAPGTARLSPYLHFGEVSPRQVWHALHERMRAEPALRPGAAAWLRQLGWREFALHLLHHFPHTPESPLQAGFADFPWREDDAALRAWQRGETGYPIVDAGLRELWATGWMHNRVRMIAGSFLVKHLLLPWQAGARWFWETLADADLANNTLGWQWVAGCGADAAPFFRIFNPVRQGERFDGEGAYVRRWLPELAGLPARHLHAPWRAPEAALRAAGVRPGRDYPHPLVPHGEARARALAAFKAMRAEAGGGG